MSLRGRSRGWWIGWTLVVVVAGCALLVRVPSLASGAKSSFAFTGPHIRVSASGTVNIRTLARIRVPRVRVAREAEENPEPQELPEPNLQTKVPPPLVYPMAVASAPAGPSPSPSASFLGQADAPQIGKTKTEAPPDTNGAVGRDKLMVTLNNNYVIQRKSDGAALSTVSIAAFWARTGAHDPFDPHVLYDPYSNRWIVTAADDPLLGTSAILYGVSDTADPQGTWHTYAIDADATDATWADYPTVGFSRSRVAIGVNMFRTGTLNYVRGRLILLDYASLRAGGDGHPVDVSVPSGFALQPVATESPTEKTLYVVEHFESTAGTYRFWSIDGSTLTLVGGKTKTNPLGPWTSPGPGNALPQEYGPGVDAGDSRIGNAVFRDGHVYYAQTIGMPPLSSPGFVLHTAVQWVELDTNGDFVQGGRIDEPIANPWNGGHSYAFASIAVNSRHDVLVGFSEFQAGDFVDAGYAFRAGTDPPNTLRAPITLKQGQGPYVKRRETGRNRWGDYSSSSVDPSDDLSLWTLQEYARVPVGKGEQSGRWGVWWGRVGGGSPIVQRTCIVPQAVGRTLRQARNVVSAGQCRVGTVKRVKSAAKARGRVVRQSPRSGTTLDAKAGVALWVGTGPRKH